MVRVEGGGGCIEGAMMVLICWGCQAEAGVWKQRSIPSMEQGHAAERLTALGRADFTTLISRCRKRRDFNTVLKSKVNSLHYTYDYCVCGLRASSNTERKESDVSRSDSFSSPQVKWWRGNCWAVLNVWSALTENW